MNKRPAYWPGVPMSTSLPRRSREARPESFEIEDDSLPLAEHAEDRAVERIGGQIELGEVGVAQDDAVAGGGVVRLDDALHGGASAGLDDFAALDAAGADVQPLGRALDQGTDLLDVRVPATLGAPVRVRHGHAPAGPLPHTSQLLP